MRAAPRNRVLRRLATTAVLQAVPILLPGRLTAPTVFMRTRNDSGCGARRAECAEDGQDRPYWFSLNPRAV